MFYTWVNIRCKLQALVGQDRVQLNTAATYSTEYVPVEYSCSITLQIGNDERIQVTQYEENGGCEL